MSSISPVAIRAGSTVATCIVVAVLVVTGLSVVESRQASLLFFAAVLVTSIVVLLVLPVHVLPALALGIIVAIPDRIADFSTSPVVTPATLVLGLWLVRRILMRGMATQDAGPLEDQGPGAVRGLRILAILLGVTMFVLIVVAPVKQFAVGWTFTYLVAVVGPMMVGRIDSESQAIRTALPWLGTVAGVYALVQAAVQKNVLYLPVYEALGKSDVQHWAVYRSDGSLGHPLLAGLFFAVVLAFCVGRWLETGRRLVLVAAVVNGLAIVATVSRGSYLAASAGVVTVLLTALIGRRVRRLRLLGISASFAVAAYLALNTVAFVERGLSEEALVSAHTRTGLLRITFDTANAYHWLGGGPANSLTVAAPFNFQGLPIENSYLQLIISLGAPGLLTFLAILATSAVIAVRNGNLGALGGLVAYAIAISGFAALDSRRNLLVLLGVLIMLCIHGRPERDRLDDPVLVPANAGSAVTSR